MFRHFAHSSVSIPDKNRDTEQTRRQGRTKTCTIQYGQTRGAMTQTPCNNFAAQRVVTGGHDEDVVGHR